MNEIKNAKEAKEKIIKKALTDADFKKSLLSDANSAIEKELGIKLPVGVKVKVVEDSSTVAHLILSSVDDKGELSDKDLSKVSGGAASTQKTICILNTSGKYACA